MLREARAAAQRDPDLDLFGASTCADLPLSPIPAANVASVPQRSPLRYPGGKTWLVPHIRAWLRSRRTAPKLLLEPFAGGAITSLTAVMEGLTERCLMAELDRDVAAFWHAALRHGAELCRRVQGFDPTRRNIETLAHSRPVDVVDRGFRTLVLNRTRRGGILAPGASLTRAGENGKGVASRWYPDTLVGRLQKISSHADRIAFCETDGMVFLDAFLFAARRSHAAVFVDPPYTAGGKRAGKRLYAHHGVDHVRLFAMLAESGVDFLMTYDSAPEIRSLVGECGFRAVQVTMRNTHHTRVPELLITPHPVFVH